MTTEMGESLCYSWLKHIKGCQIVQTNWKASMSWAYHKLNLNILNYAESWFENLKPNFSKKNYTSDNILKTTECDVLGIQFQRATQKIYAVEVAFHENGLDYGGSKNETIVKVLSKCIRIAMCLRACFEKPKIEIIFATPVIKETKKGFLKSLYSCFEILNNNSSKIGDNIFFSLVANGDFYKRIVKPLMIKNDSIADTSELFIRSCQLLKAAGANLDTTLTEEFLTEIEPISEIVWNYFVPILEKMKTKEIVALNSQQFGVQKWKILSKERDVKRHYASPIIIEGKEYYLNNHWTDQNKDNLIKWILDRSK